MTPNETDFGASVASAGGASPATGACRLPSVVGEPPANGVSMGLPGSDGAAAPASRGALAVPASVGSPASDCGAPALADPLALAVGAAPEGVVGTAEATATAMAPATSSPNAIAVHLCMSGERRSTLHARESTRAKRVEAGSGASGPRVPRSPFRSQTTPDLDLVGAPSC